jgi:hypothetical protein
MHMILTDMPLDDLKLQLRTNVSHDLSESYANLPTQQLLPIFRDPNKVVLQIKPGMGRASIVFHPPIVLEVVA